MLASLMVGSWVWIATIAGPTPDVSVVPLDDVGLGQAGLTTYWEANLPLAPRDHINEAFLVEEALYVMTDGGTVFALDADVGLIRWGSKLTDRDYTIYRPAHIHTAQGASPVIIPTTTSFNVMDRYSGDIIRSFKPPVTPGSSAVGIGHTLFTGSSDGRFYSFVWGSARTTRPLIQWTLLTGGPVTASPVLYDGDNLLFAAQSGAVYSCRAVDKTYNWSFKTGGAVLGDPVVDDAGVYVASLDRSVYKLDRGSGEPIWRFRLPCPLDEGPVVTSHTVYQHCPGYGLVAIDAAGGAKMWRHAGGRTLAAHLRQRDVVFTDDRHLHVVDHETGNTLVSIDAYPAAQVVANGENEAVYLLERSGRVLCLRPAGVPYLRPEAVEAARARVSTGPRAEPVAAPETGESVERAADPLDDDPLRSRRDVGP
ncbi:MAG: outer membrane protein assembly factor BamB family protein [Planctomycetota bacterium]|jgi:outer membrane protein assembly factor BamB